MAKAGMTEKEPCLKLSIDGNQPFFSLKFVVFFTVSWA
jgi:hypothetical protein